MVQVVKMGELGKCQNCHRLLISNAYSLCWTCANLAITAVGPPKSVEADVEQLYREVGGES